MAPFDDVNAVWQHLAADRHIGLTNAISIVAAAANTDSGRQALAKLLEESKDVVIDPDALSYLRVNRDVPRPPGVEDHRADDYFRTRFYTGTRITPTHGLRNPIEFLYFDYAIAMISGTLDDLSSVRRLMEGSGYQPVVARMPDGVDKAIGVLMVNDFRDTTFGPYRELIFMAVAEPEGARQQATSVDYVNGFSLQVPLDRGGTTYVFKLWLNELAAIDGGNDYLGTNKKLGSFVFEDKSDGTREFRSFDQNGLALVSGYVPRTLTKGAEAGRIAYAEAADRAGTEVPTSTMTTIPVASRPDDAFGKPACRWGFAVDWRTPVAQEVDPGTIRLAFGDSEWAHRYGGLGFTPALSFYAPAGVGQILHHIGDCPYIGTSAATR